MDFSDLIQRRRMTRHFERRALPSETVERLLQAARRAPSAGYTQGVSLVVVTEQETRARLAVVAGESWYMNAGHFPFISEAPLHIVVCTSQAAYEERYREADKAKPDGSPKRWTVPYWYTDAGASLMMLLLAAANEGLGAAFVGVRDSDDLRAALGIPADVHPIGIALFGYAAADKPSRSLRRGRRPIDDLVHRERW